MKSVFADTDYFIALLNPHDMWHKKAEVASKSLGNTQIITSEMVFTEFFNYFAKRGINFRKLAVKWIGLFKDNPNTIVNHQTSDQFREALSLYSAREDKEWSLTDCASILIMRKEGINEVLSNDKHFEQAGFTALLKNNES